VVAGCWTMIDARFIVIWKRKFYLPRSYQNWMLNLITAGSHWLELMMDNELWPLLKLTH
jgi:hypothetical protein